MEILSGLMIAAIIVVAVFVFILFYSSVLIVGGKEINILERRWFGKEMPKDRIFAMSDEIGVQARAKGPGLYLLIPFIYKTKKQEFTVIGNNEIGEEAHGAFKHYDLGDILGAAGVVFKTKTGELSVRVTQLRMLTKSLRPLPEKFQIGRAHV